RIEHCTIVTPQIVDRIARLGAVPVPFGSYVSYHGDKLLDWYGPERLERMFANRWMLDAGITVAGSSDFPCGPYEPLVALQSCVTRRSEGGELLGGSQRIGPVEALELYTTGAAWSAGQEGVLGRLEPGMLADFVALDADPTDVDPDLLGSVAVISTWVAGTQVWPSPAQG
ncbi:MAG TPA: amidohydrolase family protein, partial [Nitriliruptorales bacterium]